MTDIKDKLLQEDFKTILQLMSDKEVITIMARKMRVDGKTYQQIQVKLGITQTQARHACKVLSPLKNNGEVNPG
jgi:hypothetical protein